MRTKITKLHAPFVALSLLTLSCSGTPMGIRPKAPFAAVGPGPLIIAHRGGSLEAPENTIASVRHGVKVGSDWQEIDVTFSRDEQLVVIHDNTLERTTDGKGDVDQLSLTQLKKLSTGRPRWTEEMRMDLSAQGVTKVPDFGDRFAQETVPTLDEILAIPDTRLMIEMKHSDRPNRLAQAVVQAVQRARAFDRVALGSFQYELVDAVHQIDPSLPLIGIVEDNASMEKMLDLPISVLAVNTEMATEALQAAPPGVAVWTWTVYSVAVARQLTEMGVHGLITDIPRAVVKSLRPEDHPVAKR